MKRFDLSLALFCLFLVMAAAGCTGQPATQPEAGTGDTVSAPNRPGPLKVTTTIGMITDAARVVGGPHVIVTGLMGPGVDPHFYKATQGDLERLSGADVIFYNGLHLEGKMADILVKMAQRVKTVRVTESIALERLREPPELDGQYDPHVWFDVRLWMRVVERVRDTLIEMDPAQEADFRRNATAYLTQLEELDRYAREQIATIAPERRVLITAHDAFGYFGEAYGVEVMGLQGISTVAEFGLRDLSRLIDVVVERKLKAVFVESSVPTRSIEALIQGARAKGHEVAIGGMLFSDAMGTDGTPEGTYIGMVRHNLDTIVKALK